MVKFIVRRLIQSIPVLFGVSIIVFFAMQLTPGGIESTLLGLGATAENVAALRLKLGLDDPLIIQYLRWVSGVLGGDLGISLSLQVPISEVLGKKLVNTAILAGLSFVVVVVFSLVMGTISGAHYKSVFDRFTVLFTLFIAGLPVFWLGIVLLYIFSVVLNVLPMSGMYSMRNPGGIFDLLRHAVLPMITVAASSSAIVTRVTRSAMIDTLGQPYILAANSRGLGFKKVVYKHGVRNIMPTFANIAGLQIGYLVGSIVFAEIVFNWPGIGLQLYDSILLRDIPMVQACVFIVAIAFVFGNLISDVVVYALDPVRR